MPAKPNERQYRKMGEPMGSTGDGGGYRVTGYATTFDDPYVLFEDEDGPYYEVIDRHAFDDADMSDVIFQYDHAGRVFARQSNGTLALEPDEHGLRVEADLSGSAQGRELHEEIANGLVRCMSWAFIPCAHSYDKETRTTTITKVSKVFDVSAVSIPADPNTEISARSLLGGEIEAAGRAERSLRRRRAAAAARASMALHR